MESVKSQMQRRKEGKSVNIVEISRRDGMASTATESKVNINNLEYCSKRHTEPSRKNKVVVDRNASTSTISDVPHSRMCQKRVTKAQLSEEDLAELRKTLKARFKILKKTPFLRLMESTGSQAEIDTATSDRIPIFFSDVQHLVLFAALAQNSPFIPRWCRLDKCGHLSAIHILFIEGAGIDDYLRASNSLTSLSEFPFRLEVVMPSAYNGDLVEEFCSIPLSQIQRNNLISAYGSVEKAVKSSCEVFKVLRALFPIKQECDPKIKESALRVNENGVKKLDPKILASIPATDKFPRTMLLLSAWQMIEEGYPVPINATLKEKYKDFVQTKTTYKDVNNFSPMYGLDCEMCTTSIGKSECTRVSIVNEKLETILDTLVLPYNKITNYLTRYSGITSSMMKNVTTRLEDVQKFIQENLEPDAILVGQSLNFDLIALKMMHPYCIDTSVVFNVTGDRYRKSKLSYLAEHFLKESIQTGSKGHCSIEDSSASLRLVQLKLSQSVEFGDQVITNQFNFKKDTQDPQQKNSKEVEDFSGYATSLFSYASRMGKSSAIVGGPEIIEKYMDYLNPQLASYEQVNADGSHNVITKEKTISSGKVTCVITPSNQSVQETVTIKAPDNFLSVGHIQLSKEESDSLSQADSHVLERLDSWVSHMQEAVPINGLSIILLCGREKLSNGACFIQLQKRHLEPVVFKPKGFI